MSAEEVLTAFRRDALYLFLGAAFAAVGMVSAAFAVIRRQRDSLLIYFALFATMYGIRLWISSPMLAMMAQGATFYIRLRGAVNYVTLDSRIVVLHLPGPAKTI
jgi:sigma-B regulation protein RsbU (phosphoserine phosphatase)